MAKSSSRWRASCFAGCYVNLALATIIIFVPKYKFDNIKVSGVKTEEIIIFLHIPLYYVNSGLYHLLVPQINRV